MPKQLFDLFYGAVNVLYLITVWVLMILMLIKYKGIKDEEKRAGVPSSGFVPAGSGRFRACGFLCQGNFVRELCQHQIIGR